MFKKVTCLFTTIMIPVSVSAIELQDYINPNSFYDEARVEASFNLNSGNQDQTSFDLNSSGFYEINYDTLPFTWDFKFDGELRMDKDSEEGTSTKKGYDFTADTSANKYFNNTSELFGFGSFNLGYRRPDGADEDDDPYVKLGAGIGYGRVINATPLAKALRFVEELREYDVLVREPDDQTYLLLAAVVDKEEEFESKYGFEDYDSYWFEEMEKILQKAGLLKNNTLGAIGVIKMRDVLVDEPISVRKHGWLAKGGLGYVASNYNGSDSDPSVDLLFEYALPIGHEFQFIEEAGYSTILDDDIVHNLTNLVQATYEISDRIDWVNLWELDITIPTEDNAKDLITNELASVFRYHLTNQLDALVRLTFIHVEDDVDDNGNDDIDTMINMGLSYRLK